MTANRSRTLGIVIALAGLLGAFICVSAFPAVEGLGTKVRLPVFHGALTWVNLAAFTLMGVVAIVSLATRRESVYRWEEALRWIAVPMWLLGSGLGLLAALNTWDFTGSKASPISVVTADPRLMAQFWIMLGGLLLVALEFVLQDRHWQSGLDIAFVGLMWVVLMQAILGPGRALHPDSPVLNSDELKIKLLFFGIVISLAVMTGAIAWVITIVRTAKLSKDAAAA